MSNRLILLSSLVLAVFLRPTWAQTQQCSPTEYPCGTNCFPYSTVCDGVRDCVFDGISVDEDSFCQGCPQNSINCRANSTSGGNPECASNSVFCNGVQECSTNLDEGICNAPQGPNDNGTIPGPGNGNITIGPGQNFSCPINQSPCFGDRFLCVDNVLFCNGVPDCPDHSDEVLCSCPPGQLKCNDADPPSNANCIPRSQICDGTSQCTGAVAIDESPCGGCPVGSLQCPVSGICISNAALCDNRTDCRGSILDESPIICGCPQITQVAFQCGNDSSVCLERTQICNGVPDCPNGNSDDESPDLCFPAMTVLEVVNPVLNITEGSRGQETAASLCFRAVLPRPLNRPAIFTLVESNTSTATSGIEFYPNITIPDIVVPTNVSGEYTTCIDIVIVGDDVVEDVEQVIYGVQPITGQGTVMFPPNTNSIVINILDDEGVRFRTLPSEGIWEYSTMTRGICYELEYTASRLERSAPIRINFLEEGFARASDFRLTNTLVSFAPSSPSGSRQCVQFTVRRDAIVELNETMIFQASSLNPADSFVGSTNTSITIFDDDGVVLSIVSPPSIREDSAEPAYLCIQLLAVAGGLERESPVGVSIPGGNFSQDDFVVELVGDIFTPNSAVGETSCFTFLPVDDSIIEETEEFSFEVYVINPLDGFIGDNGVGTQPTATITIQILDDDGVTTQSTAAFGSRPSSAASFQGLGAQAILSIVFGAVYLTTIMS